MVDTCGIICEPPTPSFIQHKCEASGGDFDIEWESIESKPPIPAYVLELGQNHTNFNEVYRGLETKYRHQYLEPSTSYTLRLRACQGNAVGNVAHLEMTTLSVG
ncbi:unnamed protein product [Adineta steineri]|uniref:Fibronectin type-III domain-containing protein n=1 Tax=Adineta steineri TaxID=433720 RepID=A0A815P3P2_9BILA|nr:unnamed protein product [Adineta steineri]CAF1628593.1 unnamed protein product [Adineta steineri]